MSTLTVEATPPAIPVLSRVVNSASEVLTNLFFDKALPYPICSAVLGSFYGKTITFTLCSTAQMLIWNYLTPYTIELLFINKHSNGSSRFIGKTLTYGTGILGSYYLTEKVMKLIPTHISWGKERVEEENKKPFSIMQAVYMSGATYIPITIVNGALLFLTVLLKFKKQS
jgi:hypothetical protein